MTERREPRGADKPPKPRYDARYEMYYEEWRITDEEASVDPERGYINWEKRISNDELISELLNVIDQLEKQVARLENKTSQLERTQYIPPDPRDGMHF